jgi:replicative superfamily II helicase
MARLPAPGEVAEWLKAADCKSARASVRWFESSPLHQPLPQRKNPARRATGLTRDNRHFLAESSIVT